MAKTFLTLKQRWTCNGCRALKEDQYKTTCELGYNNEGDMIPQLGVNKIEPQEPCLKPITIMEYILAKKQRKIGLRR